MSLFKIFAASVFLMMSFSARAVVVPVKTKAPEIKFLSLSAPTAEPLETLLSKGDVHITNPAQHNVKLSIIFDRSLLIRKVQIESCATAEWTDGIEVFASPGNSRAFVEGGRKTLLTPLRTMGDVEAIAIVFGRNANLCLKNLKFLGEGDEPLPFSMAKAEPVKISSPYGDILFDSHPETQTALEDPVRVAFLEPQTFDRATIWTGGTAFFAHSLKLKGDNGWSETLPLRNAVSEQEVVFKKPFNGKEIVIEAPDAGEVAEIRFALRTKVQRMTASALSMTTVAAHKKKFVEAGFPTLLDSKWISSDDDKWTFLFRSDGTFFVNGFNDDSKQAREYSALGSYTVVRQEKDKLRMKISGVRFPTGVPWDGVSCPFACGSEDAVENSTSVVDSVVLEKGNEGSIMVRNRTPRARRTMTFGDLRIRRAVDD